MMWILNFEQKDTSAIVQHIQAGFGRKEKNLYRLSCIFGIQGIWFIELIVKFGFVGVIGV